jgi:type IX secretion system PorP/SprF family membrane protein
MRTILIILIFCSSFVLAQDVNFTQWTKNALFVSPSLTGSFDGRIRFNFQQREQWASVSVPFNTNIVSVDFPLNKNGFGVQLIYDQSGSSRLFLTQFNGSYSRKIREWRLGIYLGYANRSINYSDLTFIDPGEQVVSLNKSYFDVGFGLNRSFRVDYDKDLQLGYSISHLNKPNRSFLNQVDLLPYKHQIFSVLEWNLSQLVNFYPSILICIQDKQRQLVFGGELSYDLSNIKNNFKLYTSSNYRIDDALAFGLGAQYNQTFFSLNYDINVSELSPASNNFGAWEISLIYIIKHTSITRPNYQACPSFL